LAKKLKLLFTCKKKPKRGENEEEQQTDIEIANNLKELKRFENSMRRSRRTIRRPIDEEK
jgi:hypothetical protein